MADKSYVLFCLVYIICGGLCSAQQQRPNIILILADDLGWNDVGFHGSNQIPTPNIDALAFSGLILQDYYVAPICTPSRAALMTGKYPIHTGMQNGVIYGMERKALPLSEKLLPQYLKELGYDTHLVGKWHLGHYKRDYLPLNRGFDSHIGFWTGRIDMYDHTSIENGTWGFDFRRGFEVAHDLFGKYVTDIYTNEAIKVPTYHRARVIRAHNKTKPLFLMVSHSAVHSGNPYEPIRAPDSIIANFTGISDLQRRKFAAVVTKLDESVGKVVAELGTQGLLENSIILFSTDNGGPAAGFNDNAASNYPLRGVKNTLWEGGIRAAGFLWSPLIEENSRVAKQMLHITDWLPTLYGAAGGNYSTLMNMDGYDQWPALSLDLPSLRNSIVHNIDDAYDNIYGSASMMVNQWKIHIGTNYKGVWDDWYGPDGRHGIYDLNALHNSYSGIELGKLGRMPDNGQISRLRSEATLECSRGIAPIECKPLEAPCLFNVQDDPCELKNVADEQPEILQTLEKYLMEANKTAVKPVENMLDLCGDPKFWGHVFTNFGDYESSQCLKNLQLFKKLWS